MNTKSSVRSLAPALCLAALASGCGADSTTEPDPEPTLVTVHLDIAEIEVIEDCDGPEGDGDFHFVVTTSMNYLGPNQIPYSTSTDVVYDARVNLGPGAKTRTIGRTSYTVEPVNWMFAEVRFKASEWDRDIFNYEYTDERLVPSLKTYPYTYRNGWGTGGHQFITLGSEGCRVRLSWIASFVE